MHTYLEAESEVVERGEGDEDEDDNDEECHQFTHHP
jgi:hypothetical protein